MNPLTPTELLAKLEALGIPARTVEHPPVFTVEEAQTHRVDLPGVHTKNLYLRDKKKRNYLVVVPEDRAVDLGHLADRLGSGRLSFGSPERLMEFLGVTPGSVTAFAAVNDREGRVRVVLDRALVTSPYVCCHPLVNTMTTSVASQDLVRFLVAVGHEPLVVDL